MSTVKTKKVFAPILALLDANLTAQVDEIIPSVLELCAIGSRGTRETKVKRDAEGNVTHLFCYYHQEWEALEDVAYGIKKTSNTGFSNMCKLGSTQWSRQKRVADKATADILADVITGELAVDLIQDRKDEIEADRIVIVPREVLIAAALAEESDEIAEPEMEEGEV